MATIHPRINVTFGNEMAKLLLDLAVQEDKSVASLVRELTLEALELKEDKCLSAIAEESDKEEAKTYGHNEAWK